jgi:hypothetical protein
MSTTTIEYSQNAYDGSLSASSAHAHPVLGRVPDSDFIVNFAQAPRSTPRHCVLGHLAADLGAWSCLSLHARSAAKILRYDSCRDGVKEPWKVYRLTNDDRGTELFETIPN